MTHEEMEKTMEFLLDNQAQLHTDLELLKESVQSIAGSVQGIAENQKETNTQIQTLTANLEAMRLETREAFDNLIIANEVTRKLAEDVARLAIGTSQRVTKIEEQNSQQ